MVQKKTYYEKGIFKISIDFPEKYPEKSPEIKILNNIYHLSINPENNKISADFLNEWNPNTSKKELLIGIYLFFELGQNPDNSYSEEMVLEYKSNLKQFIQKAKDWSLKYSYPLESEKNEKLDLKKTNITTNNEINLIIDIKDTVLKKEYFLNKNNSIEELNEENVDLYINEKKVKFTQCYNFHKGNIKFY